MTSLAHKERMLKHLEGTMGNNVEKVPDEQSGDVVQRQPNDASTPVSGYILTTGALTRSQIDEIKEAFKAGLSGASPKTKFLPHEATFHPHQEQSIKDLIEALAPFANLAHEHDFNQMPDDAVIEVPVPVRHLKKAWVVFAKIAGETDAP